MNTKTTYAIVLASMALILIGSVSAFGGLGFGQNGDAEEMQAFHEDVQTAIENNDYEAWKSLMESQLTEEQFNSMVERHSQMQEVKEIREQMREARESGDTETFENLQEQLQELAPFNEGKGFGMGRGHMKQGFGGFDGDCPMADSE